MAQGTGTCRAYVKYWWSFENLKNQRHAQRYKMVLQRSAWLMLLCANRVGYQICGGGGDGAYVRR